MIGLLEEEEGKEVQLMEMTGTYQAVVRDGVAMGRCVDIAVGVLVEKAEGKDEVR